MEPVGREPVLWKESGESWRGVRMEGSSLVVPPKWRASGYADVDGNTLYVQTVNQGGGGPLDGGPSATGSGGLNPKAVVVSIYAPGERATS